MITLFKEITTEEALQAIEKDSEKYEGLYCDMEVKEERKFVKDNSKNIESIRKRLNAARISKTREYRFKVEAEAALIDGRLVAANLPFIALIDEHKENRARILAAEKATIEAENLAIEIERCHEEALMLDKIMLIEAQEKISEQQARDQRIADEAAAKATADAQAEKDRAIQGKLEAEEAAKNAEKWRVQALEDAKAAKIESERLAEEAKIQAQKLAESAAESARLAEVKRQQGQRDAEAERVRKIEANRKHVGSVLKSIKEQIMKDSGIDDATAKKVVNSIRGIERIKINY